MTVGEVISALTLCASEINDGKDYLLMAKGVLEIDVKNGCIEVSFSDYNTADIRIYPDGRKEYIEE